MELLIHTKHGDVEGIVQDNMRIWRGIPYGKPPVGPLRYKRAQPCDPWEGVREAKQYANRPIQFISAGTAKTNLPESEDCLYLNIWAPASEAKCPVFVYIYGGAFVFGEGTDPSYTGEAFPKDGILYVNFNFRVGPLGYFNLNLFDERFDSNCALSDVLLALRWVKDNIEAFGGNPDNITICGQSAGAATVYALLASPSAKGLFHKAISMSGFIHGISSAATHKLYIELLLKQMGLTPAKAGKLLTMPAAEMKTAVEWIYLNCTSVYPLMTFCGPAVGDDLLPFPIEEALKSGSAAGIPLLSGHTKDEASVFLLAKMVPRNRNEVLAFLNYNRVAGAMSSLDAYYGDLDDPKVLCRAMTDAIFTVGALACQQAQRVHAPVYAYRHDYVTPMARKNGLGSMHSCDNEFALGTHGSRMTPYEMAAPTEEIQRLRSRMHGAWVSFARTGDPNGAFPIAWTPFSDRSRSTLIIKEEPEMVSRLEETVYTLWNNIPRYDETY